MTSWRRGTGSHVVVVVLASGWSDLERSGGQGSVLGPLNPDYPFPNKNPDHPKVDIMDD